MELSVKLANGYFTMLKSLSRETKLRLIKMLSDSMLKEEAAGIADEHKLERLYGIWTNDPEAEAISEAIRSGRQSGKTRHIISFDE